MRTSKILPISLPPEMLDSVILLAKKEHRTKSELVREALRRYIEDKEWDVIRAYGTRKAKAMGIKTDDDIVRIVREHRRDKRKKAAHGANQKKQAG